MNGNGTDRKADPFEDILDPKLQAEMQRLSAQGFQPRLIRSKKRRRPGGEFVMVPLEWVDQLKKARRQSSTFSLAIHILHKAWRTKNWTAVKVSNIDAAKAGLSRRMKWYALRELERIGLLELTCRPKQTPVVKLLLVPWSASTS